MSDAGWPEGRPQWWWKYVFPSEKQFWLSILASKFQVADPHPDPWLEAVTTDILQGLVMLQGTSTVDEADVSRLKREAVDKINLAVHQIGT